MIEPLPALTAEHLHAASALSGDAAFASVVRRCNIDYLYWDKAKYHAAEFDPRVVWAAVHAQRLANAAPITFGGAPFRFYVTDAMQEVLHLFDMQMGGAPPLSGAVGREDKRYYLASSLMEEAIASSQMEGASTTRKVAKDMLRQQRSPKDRSQQMIANNYQTIRYLVEHCGEELSQEALLRVHQMITAGTLDNASDESRFRTTDDIVVADSTNGEIAHVPPAAQKIPALADELCAFFNTEHSSRSKAGFIHPLVKAVIIHFLFAWLHPFTDGNGRTARSLVYWFLLRQGYRFMEHLSISRIIYRTKAQYEKAFLYTERDGGDLGYFLHYNLSVMQKASDELNDYLERKAKERTSVSAYVQQGLNDRQASLVARLKNRPESVVTVKEYESLYAVSNQTARTDLYGMASLGWLTEIALNRRKSGFVLNAEAKV